MLADDSAVARRCYLGPGRAVRGARARDLLVEMGTMSPDLSPQLAARAAAAGKVIVTRRSRAPPRRPRRRTLLIMAGAEADMAAAPARRSSTRWARQTIWLGPAGRRRGDEARRQLLIHGLNQTVAEALTLAERGGHRARAAPST